MHHTIYLSIPALNGEACKATLRAAYLQRGTDAPIIESQVLHTSLLANSFNQDWAMALALAARGQVTHFCMLHADVVPEPGWLGKLLEEMERTEAQVLSAVVRIKSEDGSVSVAVDEGDAWEPRRLTCQDLCELPETFSIDDCGKPGDVLLVNTGCLLVDLRGGWAHETDDDGCLKTYFTISDRIRPIDGGKYLVSVRPEDWNFSRMAAASGARVMATTCVTTSHRGLKDFGTAGIAKLRRVPAYG